MKMNREAREELYDPKKQHKGSWLDFVKQHKHLRTAKGLLDLKAISKLWKGQKALDPGWNAGRKNKLWNRVEKYSRSSSDDVRGHLRRTYDPDMSLIAKAKKHFGITRNSLEAGYILPDGTMLDLSGRHYASGYKNNKPLPGKPDYLRNSRGVDHRELDDLVKSSGTSGMLEFMERTEAIRFHNISGDLNIAIIQGVKITPAQMKVLSNSLSGNIYFDLLNKKGDTIKGITVKSTSALKKELIYDPAPRATSPPKSWFKAMYTGIKNRSDVRNPAAIVSNIWKKLTPEKRATISAKAAKGGVFKYDLPLPDDRATQGTGTLRMVKPFKLAEVQVNLKISDYLAALKSGLFSKMKRNDGTVALVARCKSQNKNCNIFVDKVT